MPTKEYDRRGLALWVLAVAVALLFALWQYWTPVQLDDLWYQAYYLGFADGRSHGFDSWLDYVAWHRVDSNGRLANYLAPLATLVVPRWLFAALTGVFAAGLYLLITRLSGYGCGRDNVFNLRWMALVWGASLVLFPWRDWLMHHDYVLNYLVATVVDLLFMWVWLAALSRRLGAPAFLLGCVAALTGAMMHEGLSVPMLAACCIVVLVRRFGIGWQCWVLLGLFLLGTAECALAPGIMSRAARDVGGDVQARAFVVAKGCVLFFVLLACVCAGLAVGRWRKAVRRLARRPAFQMCVVNAFVGMVLCGAFADASVRFGWVTQIYSAIALGMIVRRSGIMHRRSAGSLAMVAGVLAAVVLVNTAAVERRFYIEDVQIRRGLSESAHGTLFHDLDRLSLVERLVTLSLPGGECWGGAFQQGGYNRLHPDRVYAVVPSSLESFDGRFDSVFGGDACIGRWRGMWLGRAVDSDAFDRRGCMAGQVSLRLTMADGEVRPIVADSWLFHTPDGRRWLYYHYYDWPEGVAAINFDIPD